MNTKNIIITGGCGFIGHHFVEHIFLNTDWNIIVFDKLSYASMGYSRLRDTGTLKDDRVKIFSIDLVNPISDGVKREIGTKVDYIVHMAAETHVDNSITNPELFIKNNIMSTFNMLEYARELKKLHDQYQDNQNQNHKSLLHNQHNLQITLELLESKNHSQ